MLAHFGLYRNLVLAAMNAVAASGNHTIFGPQDSVGSSDPAPMEHPMYITDIWCVSFMAVMYASVRLQCTGGKAIC